MGKFDPNTHDTGDREVVPAGTYLVHLDTFERRTSESSRKDYLAMEFVILSGPYKGRKVFDNMSLNEKALWRLAQLCKAVGFMEEFDLDDDEAVAEALQEKKFALRTKTETYQGDKRSRVHSFKPASEKMVSEYDEDAANPDDDDIPF